MSASVGALFVFVGQIGAVQKKEGSSVLPQNMVLKGKRQNEKNTEKIAGGNYGCSDAFLCLAARLFCV